MVMEENRLDSYLRDDIRGRHSNITTKLIHFLFHGLCETDYTLGLLEDLLDGLLFGVILYSNIDIGSYAYGCFCIEYRQELARRKSKCLDAVRTVQNDRHEWGGEDQASSGPNKSSAHHEWESWYRWWIRSSSILADSDRGDSRWWCFLCILIAEDRPTCTLLHAD